MTTINQLQDAISDISKQYQDKLAALEKLLAEACITLEHSKYLKTSAITVCSSDLRDWFGSYRAKQKRESDQKTSGEAWKV